MGIYLGSQSVSVYLGTSAVTVPGVYIGGLQVFPTGPSVPGAPAIVSATQSAGSTTVVFSPPESDGGSPITSYKFYVEGFESAPTSVVGTTATWADQDGFGDVQVSAVNAVGEGPKSAAVEVVDA